MLVSGRKEPFVPQALPLAELRQKIGVNAYTGSTSGLAPGYLQANLVILPADWANDFLLFCQRNPVACPLIGVTEPGCPFLNDIGADIDISRHAPEYHVFYNGQFDTSVADLSEHWRDDLVAFVLGCSFSFEDALVQSGLTVRNIEQGRNVSMYDTQIACQPAGRFSGNLVVSMRPFTSQDAIRAIQITSRYPKAHGAPVHFGTPAAIGISDINTPNYGDAVDIFDGEVPVFWACGVTPQNVIRHSKPPICITHAPGKMLITNLLNNALSVL
ncbi:putative hydro-lyase [Salinivibrio costicola]|uniref:Putative hydro-lyase HBA18_13965 n=1 Tax=Salinivibrio costicola TaxID=51367 RepID=A0ABX6K7N1_SALCS|nr:putative hydro-lyase [Salinivibrio costicola]QIR07522.1 putative hydro-lyase [Salinivibrio costicola]